jgi:hypothetical protein
VTLARISGWLNGNDEQRFAISEALSDLEDIFAINREAGELIKAYIDSKCNSFRQPNRKPAPPESVLADVSKETSEAVVANLRQFPVAVQLKEIAEGEQALTRLRECVEAKRA